MTHVFEPRITMITLGVADLAVSAAFYERLGFARSSASTETVAFLKTRGTVLGLYGHAALAEDAGVTDKGHPAFRGVALAHNVASPAEVDALFDYAVECGATAVKRPEKVFWGGYSGYFADPDGHLWELAHNPFAPLDDDGHMTLPA